jgi:hypothetical protein
MQSTAQSHTTLGDLQRADDEQQARSKAHCGAKCRHDAGTRLLRACFHICVARLPRLHSLRVNA